MPPTARWKSAREQGAHGIPIRQSTLVSVEPARSMTTLGYPRFPQGDGVDSAIEALAGAERSMTGKIGPLKGHRAAGHYSLG